MEIGQFLYVEVVKTHEPRVPHDITWLIIVKPQGLPNDKKVGYSLSWRKQPPKLKLNKPPHNSDHCLICAFMSSKLNSCGLIQNRSLSITL